MKTLLNCMLLAFLLCTYPAVSQLITPAPGDATVCPADPQIYTFSPDSNYSGCGSVTWTVTHGSFSSSTTVTTKVVPLSQSVTVYWDDYAGNGTLKGESTCPGSGGPVVTSTSSIYAIKSLAGRVPSNLRANQSLPYCSVAGISIQVDIMYLENTGGATGITQQVADGYEWTIPSNWTGSSTTNFLNITPANGCVGGSLTVKAYVNCTTGKKYSAPATISLDRPAPNLVVNAQAGYSGPSCGSTQPVTFTVFGSPSCVSSSAGYDWVFPPGWNTNHTYTSTNSITVTPSGQGTNSNGVNPDAGVVTVTLHLSCGSALPATLTLTSKRLAISMSPLICQSGTPVSLSGVSSSTPVTWSSSPATVSVTSGQGTNSATIAAPSVGSYGFTRITATANCLGSVSSTYVDNVWVGTPGQPGIISGNTTPNIGSIYNYVVYPGPEGAPLYNWLIPADWSWWGGGISGPINTLTPNFMVGSIPGRVQMYGINGCGNGAATTLRVFPQVGPCITCPRLNNSSDSQMGDEIDSTYAKVAVYPNPTSTEFTVRLKERTEHGASLDLIDSGGDIKKSLLVTAGTQFVKVSVNEILAGIYVVRVKEGFKTYSKKILIQH